MVVLEAESRRMTETHKLETETQPLLWVALLCATSPCPQQG